MYKKIIIWTVTHESLEGGEIKIKKNKKREGVRTDETKTTTRVIACYCWKEDGHLFQSLL